MSEMISIELSINLQTTNAFKLKLKNLITETENRKHIKMLLNMN